MRYADEPIHSVGNLVERLKTHLQGIDKPVWFRGQSKSEWSLVPKLQRGDVKCSAEVYLISRFKQNATLLLQQRPKDDFEWLFLMQHHSMPTRLLDWSESPLVGMYFAVTENRDDEGALWVLLPTVLNEKSNYRPDYPHEIPSFEDVHLQNYLPETVASERRSRLFPIAALAPRNSPRMQSQQGVFTISHRDPIPVEDAGADGAVRDHAWRYLIPPAAKPRLQKELRILGITRFQLFPELDSLGQLLPELDSLGQLFPQLDSLGNRRRQNAIPTHVSDAEQRSPSP